MLDATYKGRLAVSKLKVVDGAAGVVAAVPKLKADERAVGAAAKATGVC